MCRFRRARRSVTENIDTASALRSPKTAAAASDDEMTAGPTHLFVLTAAAMAATAMGRPQQCSNHNNMLSDYEKSMLAQYFPAAAQPSAVAPEPMVLDYEGSVLPRLGRSNANTWSGMTDFAEVDPLKHAASPVGRYFGYMERAPTPRSTAPCGAAAEPATARRADVNDTVPAAAAAAPSAAAIEKLTAYYEQLKAQQETLARQQLQQQLYDQQQRRQQQFLLMQQQIQQQYYQQQEHAMMMFDRLRKNPAFVNQLAAFVDQKRVEVQQDQAAGNNGAATPPPPVAAAAPPGAAAAAAKTPEAALPAPRVADKKPGSDRDRQAMANRVMDADKDVADGDDACGAKRVGARQAASSAAARSAVAEDEQAEYEDEQSPPVLEKVYSSVSE